jgi:hypothetical protein
MKRQTQHRIQASVVSLLLAVVALVSCGGDGTVGSGGTGYAPGQVLGTVNGFGSVIVDGVAYDDRSVAAIGEVAPGVDAPADVKLGQRVSVEYETAGVASVLRVEPSLAGPIASVVSGGTFSMLGQTVAVNTDGAAGPVTQFGGGYDQASDLQVGDAVEVHGVAFGQSGAYVIQATRIEKLMAMPAYLRVSGLVGNLGASSSQTFSLASLTVREDGAAILPMTTRLADDEAVTLLALPATLATGANGSIGLQAAEIRIRQLSPSALDAYVSGYLSHLDAQAKTFRLGSQTVSYAQATVTPTQTSLADGQYVQVRGTVGSGGPLTAASVMIRDTASDDDGELRGDVSAYDAATQHFVVRGAAVDGSAAALQGCPTTGLADGLFVDVHGPLTGNGVQAQTVKCESEPSGATVEREGKASAVDTVALTFSLTSESGTVTSVHWTSLTFFGGVTPATLAGKSVEVEGTFSGSVLNATKVKFDD